MVAGIDNYAVYRFPRPHILVLLRLSRREGRRTIGLRQLRGRPLVGSGEFNTPRSVQVLLYAPVRPT